MKLRGLWVTDKGLTALETAATVADGSVFLDRASTAARLVHPGVPARYCRNLGARGSARAGDLLVAAADRADSAAERRAVALLRAAEHRPAGYWGTTSATYVIDIAFPEAMLAVEIDGWAWHMGVDRFRADRHKGTRSSVRAGTCCGSPGTT